MSWVFRAQRCIEKRHSRSCAVFKSKLRGYAGPNSLLTQAEAAASTTPTSIGQMVLL